MLKKSLVLDGMGVLYRAGNVVDELLVPFVSKYGVPDRKRIRQLYIEASSGKFTSDEFWRRLNIDPGLEDEYLSGHGLNMGVEDFLENTGELVDSVWCLSNDVSAWSVKLRRNLNIEKYFRGFIISGDVKARKPDREIYQAFIDISRIQPEQAIFVDDREMNLDAAADYSFTTILFDPPGAHLDSRHTPVRCFQELYTLLMDL